MLRNWFEPFIRDQQVRQDLRSYCLSVPLDSGRNWSAELAFFDKPAVVVWAPEDQMMPPDHGRRLADQLPDGRLVEITDSYTVVPLEQPKQLADAVRLRHQHRRAAAVSSTPVGTRPVPRQATRPGSWRLGHRLRKTVLLLHVVAGGSWFGLDVAMAVLVATAISTDSTSVRAYTPQSLKLITVWPMFSAAMRSLITGALLGPSAASTASSATGGWRSSWPSIQSSPFLSSLRFVVRWPTRPMLAPNLPAASRSSGTSPT
jgi:hypothetical protein